MPSWFKKVFGSGAAKPVSPGPDVESVTPVEHPPSLERPALGEPAPVEAEESESGIRRVVHAPQVIPEDEQSSWSESIRIKARIDPDRTACTFLVDRPVLEKYSAWFPEPGQGTNTSPLAEALFAIDGVGSVLIHNFTARITKEYTSPRSWEDLAHEVGTTIREHLKAGYPVVTDSFLENMPEETTIGQRLQTCIDLEINPGIAAHSGVISLERVVGNTAYITMGGGCQGCAASTVTLRQGIHGAFRSAVPQVGAIYDETDHASGTNPYFKEMPPEMMEDAMHTSE